MGLQLLEIQGRQVSVQKVAVLGSRSEVLSGIKMAETGSVVQELRVFTSAI
jgi:hypothetical protein